MSDMGVYTCEKCGASFLTKQAKKGHKRHHKND